MRTQKIIFQALFIFSFLLIASSCALFKKNCDCPKFNQQFYEPNTEEFAVELSPKVDSSRYFQLRNIK